MKPGDCSKMFAVATLFCFKMAYDTAVIPLGTTNGYKGFVEV
jgi:hypothetical protein